MIVARVQVEGRFTSHISVHRKDAFTVNRNMTSKASATTLAQTAFHIPHSSARQSYVRQ